jgi:hypothetical protein
MGPDMCVDLSEMDPERDSLYCRICTVRGGGVIQCAFSRCMVSFHPFCAYSNGLMMVLRSVDGTNDDDDDDDDDILGETRKGSYESYCCPGHAIMCRLQGIIAIANDINDPELTTTATNTNQQHQSTKLTHSRALLHIQGCSSNNSRYSNSGTVVGTGIANYSQESPTGLFNTQVNMNSRKPSKHTRMKRLVCCCYTSTRSIENVLL